MNSDGHTRLAALVNEALSETFLDVELADGSVDPDTNGSGRSYRGDLSKHHHDPGGSGNGRYHGSDTIVRIVREFCKIARTHWLLNHRPESSFEFGVATHYFMDGFICSPSVSEDRHAEGDARFARAVARLAPNPVPRPDERAFSSRFLDSQLVAIAGFFGSTDTEVIPKAYEVLVRLGYAVTAPEVPQTLQDRSKAALATLDEQRRNQANNLARWVAEETSHLPERVWSVFYKVIRHSHLIWFFVAVAKYRRRGQPFGAWLSCWVAGIVERYIAWKTERPFREVVEQSSRHVQAANCLPTVESDWDRDWYNLDVLLVRHRGESSRRLEDWAAYVKSCRASHRATVAQMIDAGEDKWVGGEFPGRWADSFADKIGHNRHLVAAACGTAVAVAITIAGLLADAGHEVFGMLLAIPLCAFSFLAWRTGRVCERICGLLWRRGTIQCPHCGHDSMVEILSAEDTAQCPSCNQPNLPVVLTQERGP